MAHEYIAVGTFRVFNFLAFSFMLVSVPVMHLQHKLRQKVDKNMNNLCFWLFYTVLGQPFAILFCYYQKNR